MDLEALKKSFLKKFQEDSADRLQKIQLGILELEKSSAGEAAEQLARELHTMKGEARILGLNGIGQVAHAAEDVLKSAREEKTATAAATDLLLRACDVVADLLEDVEAAKLTTGKVAAFCEQLGAALGHAVAVEAPVEPPARRPAGKERRSPSAPGLSGRADEFSQPMGRATDRSIRVRVEILDQLGLLAGDLLVESAKTKLRSNELNDILKRFSRMGDRFLRLGEGNSAAVEARLERELLESDLHLLRDDAFRFIRQHADGLDFLHGSLSLLAESVGEARLIPLSAVFDAFPRAMRELAREQGKEVELAIDNPNVGVDRSMLSDVRDALIHLLRNAIDHGLEPPEFREALGKPRAGRVSVRVRAAGDMLELAVVDDGRGIDPERIRAAAMAKGLITAEQARAMGEREAIELIFISGFSTREQVSEVSGRGVGMDVVRRNVEALGGALSVHSRLGLGTTLSIRLPQSLALMRVLLVRLGTDVYGIPAADVEAVTRVGPKDRLEVMGQVAVRHRGAPVTLVALGPLLGLNGGPRHERVPAVVVRHGVDTAALVVDGFVGEREVAVKPCGGEFLKGAPFIAGTAAMEDGRIAVLLQVPDIMGEVRRLARPAAQPQASRKLRVLVVDDSPIARATESALVRALGHQVEEAQDGEEALARLRVQPFDLVLTDVQMPRMDGFTLTRRLKLDPAHRLVPVVILSSLASAEDRRRGLDAGADAYLIKGELGVESLAQTFDRLV
jgi:two-component system, chemotaxis family, sensor kinase CheA